MGAVRRLAAWLPAVVTVPVVLAAGVWVTAPEKDEEAAARAVMPLDVGNTWVYAVSDHGTPSGTRTRQVTSQAPVDLDTLTGVALTSHYTDYPGVGETSNLIYLVPKDGELLQYGVVSGTRTSRLDPPAPLYRYPPHEGDAWTYRGTVGTVDVTLDVELLGIEDVDIGGRTFPDCAHYRTSQHVGADSPEEVVE